METALNKLKEWKKIVYVALCVAFLVLTVIDFVSGVKNDAGFLSVFVGLMQNIFEGAILAAGLYGLLAGKDAFCRVAFALLLGSALYGLISGVLGVLPVFRNFDGARVGYILYYVFSFLTGLAGTAFAVLVVLGWILGRDDLKKIGGYCGLCYVAMSILMIVFTIVRVADKQDWLDWTDIVDSIYAVLRRTVVVILATSGAIAYEAVEAAAALAAKEEAKAEEPAAPAEEEKTAEATED